VERVAARASRRRAAGRPRRGRCGGRARPLAAVYVEYALNAFALVPHMVFLVDFVARGLGRGVDAGSRAWVLFGVGAMLGPVLAGAVADRIGFRAAMRLGFVLQTILIGVLALTSAPAWIIVSSLVVGAFVPGMVPLTMGRVYELAPADTASRTAAWSRAATSFALGQASAGYGLSFVYARSGDYTLLFALGAGAAALALALDVGAGAVRR
jgi:predicted MFS family arabinose efflux permease